MRKRPIFLALIWLLATVAGAKAQSCPDNIGFEKGDLTGWQCYTGILDYSGTLPVDWVAGAPVPGRHTVVQNSSPQALDPYGHFPINSPNGSKYSVQLGNAAVGGKGGAQCERMTYIFTVPDDDYTLIYYYAVVFENPSNHPFAAQPQFIANVTNLDNPLDQQCGSFSFTASAGLEGFQKSNVGTDIYYKPWSPLTIKLSGRKGQRVQLEFITRDCSQGGHFGYAYVDFNENCASAITGNGYCTGINTVTLTAPAGFQQYTWTDTSGTVLSTTPTLKISPPPPDGTLYKLHIVPYEGLGCENVFTTTVNKINEVYNLQVLPNITGCTSTGVDLTQASVTAGSSPGQTFQYYTDPDGQNFLSDPKLVVQSGTYYIRGSNAYGCTDIAPINVTLYNGANIAYKAPAAVCAPATVDITRAVTSTDAGVIFKYYSDAALAMPVANPMAVAKTGTYYVTATSLIAQCIEVQPVDVVVSDLPQVQPQTIKGCPPVNITATVNTADNSNITYNFFTDADATIPAANISNITSSGTYYYRATNQYGCAGNIASINVLVFPPPYFTVTDPQPVTFPNVINLANTHPPLTGASFTYYLDTGATKPLTDYQAVGVSGTFYIKAVNEAGCAVIHPVHVLINAPPEPDLIAGNTFTPNGDGINDLFTPEIKGVVKMNYLKIFNRYGQQVFETTQILNRWTGYMNGKPEPTGTYYWVFSSYDLYRKKEYTRSGAITIIR